MIPRGALLTATAAPGAGGSVDGVLYDVQFIDGSCIELFDGCDEASDFKFQTFDAARSGAMLALLDQVLVDTGIPGQDFESSVDLVNGCSATNQCLILTPFTVDPELKISMLINRPLPSSDTLVGGTGNPFDPAQSTVSEVDRVYAVWSLPAEPTPASFQYTALFNISADPHERFDRSADFPDVLAVMCARRTARSAIARTRAVPRLPPVASTQYPAGRRARPLSPLAHLYLLRSSAYTPTNVSKRAHTCGRGRDTRTAERCTMAQEVSDGAQGSCAIGLTRGVRVCAPWARRWGRRGRAQH